MTNRVRELARDIKYDITGDQKAYALKEPEPLEKGHWEDWC